MELFSKFKRDYFNYLISIIIPAVISGLSIPVFKRLLGSIGYGTFALWFNAVLIISAVLSGWIAQSIVRFYPTHNLHKDFSTWSLKLSRNTQLIIALPCFVVAWIISKDWILGLLFSIAVFSSSLQFTILPIIQSAFLSRKIVYSESLRVVIYVGGSVVLLMTTNLNYIYCLFISVICSYIVSYNYLLNQRNKFVINSEGRGFNPKEFFKKFLSYGTPLSFWFVCTYLSTYVDKLFAYHQFGASTQGNYQAIFDFLNKSLVLLISPVITSLVPLLTRAYEQQNREEILGLMKKIFLLELAGYILASFLYWWFGARLLMYILNSPDTPVFRWMGFIIISATFVWQFSVLVQKKFELRLRTNVLLFVAVGSLIVQCLFYFIFSASEWELIAPLGYLLSAIFYFSVISIPVVRFLLNNGARD